MPFFHFDDLEKEYATPKYSTAFGELIAGEKLEMGRLTFEAGEGVVEHSHPQEQIMYVLSGKLKVEFPDETQEIGAGSAFLAPSDVKHRVTALEDAVVISVKDMVEGVGHKLAPEERDRLEELGKV